MDDIDDFRTFYELADRIISEASKDDVAEAARLLALNVAHYQLKYGALPLENFAGVHRADDIDAKTAELLSAGMQKLVGAPFAFQSLDRSQGAQGRSARPGRNSKPIPARPLRRLPPPCMSAAALSVAPCARRRSFSLFFGGLRPPAVNPQAQARPGPVSPPFRASCARAHEPCAGRVIPLRPGRGCDGLPRSLPRD
jgi:hypothetical protein